MGIRFVEPTKTMLTLADGTRLTVKHELNAGEQITMSRRIRSEPEEAGFILLAAYLLDWSAEEDIRGLSPVELEPIIRRLSFESIIEIKDAIEQHQAAVAAALEEKKTSRAIASMSEAISTSVS